MLPASLLVGSVVAVGFLFAGCGGSGSGSDLCAQQCACSPGCTPQLQTSCEQAADSEQKSAAALGCTSQLDAMNDCLASAGCDAEAAASCTSQEEAYGQCASHVGVGGGSPSTSSVTSSSGAGGKGGSGAGGSQGAGGSGGKSQACVTFGKNWCACYDGSGCSASGWQQQCDKFYDECPAYYQCIINGKCDCTYQDFCP